ncbi:sulfurtransferase [Chryseomicrobium palamuruense]|uniref:Sulfurtransferase n=1 Tax=Chryseomicrobium palamuruense TaxID=682973 RepID=A0ABV8UTY9_9BACL
MIFLKNHMELPKQDVRYIDTRFDLTNPEWGEETYYKDHVQGAIYWHLEEHLSDMTRIEGRHPAPTKEQMTKLIQVSGLTYDDAIVVYDQGNAPFAARAALLLLWAGFKNISIAREGYGKLREVLPIEGGVVWVPTSNVQLTFEDAYLATQDDVKHQIMSEKPLIDARSNDRYKGIHEPIDSVAGHIPTAINIDWEQLKTEDGLMTQDESAKLFKNLSKQTAIITYCGSGVTAAPLTLALLENDFLNTRLYSGSYSDWILNNHVETSK